MSLVSKNNVATNKYELEIAISPEDFESAIAGVYKKRAKEFQIPGFRKGKAPRKTIEKLYGEQIFFEEAVNAAAPAALQAAYVTNGIAHARMLVQKGCRTYLPGGQVRPITEAITGPETLAALQHYNFTKAFMGANGVSPAEGFTTPDPEEASIKTAALQRARERWFLVDNTKFDMVYSAVIGDIGCGAILTNHCPDPRYAQLTFVKECSV